VFAIGSLVRARGREWVVLPESDDKLLVLRPLGGADDEVTGIYMPLEKVELASFDLPNPQDLGDHRSCRFLRDAVRLSFRHCAGPFRSLGRIAVEPRPYQLVPLLMALKLDPVRLLIADDVGIGKTVEAGLIARELMDRGEASGLVVLCPPALAEQWQTELERKFHIEAELVLPSTASRLERHCRVGQSLFDVFSHVIVSTDFIKADRRRDEFLRSCPKLVIVDEAHTCASGDGGGRHQRHDLLVGLAKDPERHLILVTATPHSGKEEAFRSLLALLNPEFGQLPEELGGKENEAQRRRLAAHLVQRRRGDIRHFMKSDTPFPEREEKEEHYKLSPKYKQLFERALDYARETVTEKGGGAVRQRVRWWSALALLRSLGSSPAAAAETLRTRASANAETEKETDELGRRAVLDIADAESMEGIDVSPGADSDDEGGTESKARRRLLEMAGIAESLKGKGDEKLQKAIQLIRSLIADGFHPIVFCRFIPTAHYLADELRQQLRNVEVTAVTGHMPPTERVERIAQLGAATKRVLVCTDCLSEGINLQDHFDAVFHYDLSWNPTRHEQRDGRVDRYGQLNPNVRILTYYGTDNQIDGIVLDVLMRKHQRIRSSLGISVPLPIDTDQVIEAIFEGLLLREKGGRTSEQQLALFEDFFKPKREQIHAEWEKSAEREKRSRTMFAQETIREDELAPELKAIRDSLGSDQDLHRFVLDAFRAHQAVATGNLSVKFDLREVPRALRDATGGSDEFTARFAMPIGDSEILLTRTHPIVEGLATYVLDTALDPQSKGVARRCGVIRTGNVSRRTTLLLLRIRYHLITKPGETEQQLLAEDCALAAFEGAPGQAEWLDDQASENLLTATPSGNVLPDQAAGFVARVIEGNAHLIPHLESLAQSHAQKLLEAHVRVRRAARMRTVKQIVKAQLPVDVLGIYVFLPLAGVA
jgi:hypothetical protein